MSFGYMPHAEFVRAPQPASIPAHTCIGRLGCSQTIQRSSLCSHVRAASPTANTTTAQDRESGKLTGDQKFLSLLPPVRGRATAIEQLDDGLWTATQPLLVPPGFTDAGLRLTAARMADGSLWVHNPVAPTRELLTAIRSRMGNGRVSHIVVPNGSPEHWYFLGAFAQHFPDAIVWTPPDFFSGRRTLFPSPGLGLLRQSGRIRSYGSSSPAEWGGEVTTFLLDSPSLLEGAFLLRAFGTLLVSDNCIKVDEAYSGNIPLNNWIAEQIGVWQRLGPFFIKLFDRHPEVTKEWARSVLQHDFHTVVPSHAAAPIPDGKAAFAACFPELAEQL